MGAGTWAFFIAAALTLRAKVLREDRLPDIASPWAATVFQPHAPPDPRLRIHRVTAYCSCPLCCGQWSDGVTASGRHAVQGHTAADTSVWSFGTCLGPYEILAPPGAGGMGEVYRATDTKLGREVATKLLPEDLAADRDRLARFQLEAQAAGALNHPNVLTVFELGQGLLVDGARVESSHRPGRARVPVPVERGRRVANDGADEGEVEVDEEGLGGEGIHAPVKALVRLSGSEVGSKP